MASAVIFDMDGVLVASAAAHAASWRIVARQDGIQMSADHFRETFGRPSRDIIRMTWGQELSDEQVRAIDDRKERAYRDLIRGMVPLTVGAREVLAALRAAGLRTAIATSGPRENVELMVTEKNLSAAFDAIVTGFDVQHGKPAPDCFLLAAERLGLPPRACVVVEDAPVGIEAAHAAGMPCIAYVGTHPAERLRATGAAAVITRLDEVVALAPRL